MKKIPNDTRNPVAKQWILDNSTQYTTREDAFRAYNSEIGEVSRSQFSQLWRYHARPTNPKARIGKRLSIEAKIMRTIEALHRIQSEYVRQQAKLRRVVA